MSIDPQLNVLPISVLILFPRLRELGEVKLIPVYYTGIVTGWGCTFCLHTVVGEGWYHKDFLNQLPGPKSRSAVCGYCRPWPFTLLIYSYV